MSKMKLSEFSFDVAHELITQHPTENRDEARMMVIYILFCILFEIVISIFFSLGYLKNFTFITLTASFVFVMISQIIVLKRKK